MTYNGWNKIKQNKSYHIKMHVKHIYLIYKWDKYMESHPAKSKTMCQHSGNSDSSELQKTKKKKKKKKKKTNKNELSPSPH